MREKLEDFRGAGVQLACVVQGTAADAARFCGRHGIQQVCIPDPEKESYRAMGFRRTSWKTILFPGADLKRRREEAGQAGCSMSVSGTLQKHSDVLQLPGAALVAQGGRILWLHRATHTGDLPPADELLEVVRRHLSG